MAAAQNANYSDKTKRNIYITVAGVLLAIAFVIASLVYKIGQPRIMGTSELKINGAYMFDTPRAFKPFVLTDHLGQQFVPSRFDDKWTLVFFGFTHCPDVCPTTMSLLNQLMIKLAETGDDEDTQVIMVSVDPARDTVDVLAQYVPYFNPGFIGVTGQFLDIHRFATQLNTPFRKVMEEDGSYQVEHGGNIALINPKGHYHGFFKTPHDLAKLRATYRSVKAVF
jgi:protein SCO1/2